MSNDLCRLRKGGQGRNVVERGIVGEADGIGEVEKALVRVFERHLGRDAR